MNKNEELTESRKEIYKHPWKNQAPLRYILISSLVSVFSILVPFLEDTESFLIKFPYDMKVGLLFGIGTGVCTFLIDLVKRTNKSNRSTI